MTFNHTTGLLEPQGFQKKLKRPMKAVKAQQRPDGDQKQNFKKFSTYLGSLGVFYCMISIFLNFKVFKAKKATLLAGAAFFHLRKFIESKLVL